MYNNVSNPSLLTTSYSLYHVHIAYDWHFNPIISNNKLTTVTSLQIYLRKYFVVCHL